MRKIKNIKQLQSEKKRIKQEQEELENRIRSNWSQLKECLKPSTVAKETFSSIFKNKAEENVQPESVLKNTFTYGAALLAKKIADKTENIFYKMCRK
jgi:cell division septum initiation protein DivIVA